MGKSADVFVTDAGTEVSVRTSRDPATGGTTVEPLYASDIELLQGASGELRSVDGEPLRGTLWREGGVFLLSSAESHVRRRSKEHPPAPVTPARPRRKARATQAATSNARAIDAADTLSRFVRDMRGVSLQAAREAYAVLGRFLERQAGRHR